jgi:hypothetical protein
MDMSKLPATAEANSAMLGQLSDEVSRIATTLARLAMRPEVGSTSHPEQLANDIHKSDIPIETVRNVIRARRLRYEFFDKELFADPAWDMLLDLFHAEIAELRVNVSSLCTAAAVPPTTALRWINLMTDADLFRRSADPYDARRVFVRLSPMTSAGMSGYFKKLEEPPSPTD